MKSTSLHVKGAFRVRASTTVGWRDKRKAARYSWTKCFDILVHPGVLLRLLDSGQFWKAGRQKMHTAQFRLYLYSDFGFPSDFDILHSSFAIIRVRPLLPKTSTSRATNVKQIVVIFNFSTPYLLEAAHARASAVAQTGSHSRHRPKKENKESRQKFARKRRRDVP